MDKHEKKASASLAQEQFAAFLIADLQLHLAERESALTLVSNRYNYFLATVTIAGSALFWFNQQPGGNRVYLIISLGIFISLLLLGLNLFLRAISARRVATEQTRAIDKIRYYFAQLPADLPSYFSHYSNPELPSYRALGREEHWWFPIGGLAGMIATVNSALACAAAGVASLLVGSSSDMAFWFVGVTWVVTFGAQVWYQLVSLPAPDKDPDATIHDVVTQQTGR
jgi:hypothetical protein